MKNAGIVAELLEKRNLTTYKYTKNCNVSKNSAYNVSIGARENFWLYNRFTGNTGSYNLIFMRQ